jgi:hypothetical protein
LSFERGPVRLGGAAAEVLYMKSRHGIYSILTLILEADFL